MAAASFLPPVDPGAVAPTAFAVAIAALLILHGERLRVAVKSHADRRRLRRIAARREAEREREGGDDGGGGGGGDGGATGKRGGGGRPRVAGLFVHPVKSLQPVSLSETKFDKHGLAGDRRFMIVRPNPRATTRASNHSPCQGAKKTEADFRFFTQRQSPSLATIRSAVVASPGGGGRRRLELSSDLLPRGERRVSVDVSVPTTKSAARRRRGRRDDDGGGRSSSSSSSRAVVVRAGLWSDEVNVVDVGDEAADFVSRVARLDDPSFGDVRLVSIVDSAGGDGRGDDVARGGDCTATVRDVSELYCPDAARLGFGGRLPQGGLTDGFPILVATQASLDELNKRLAKKNKAALPMSRFRPNIVIDNTTEPFDEDSWKAIQIGDGPDSVILHVVKGCPRCKQSCTDQLTGERGEEPLETLSDFRALGASDAADVYFAQNAVLNGDASSYGGTVRVGDPVTILTRGRPVWDSETVRAE